MPDILTLAEVSLFREHLDSLVATYSPHQISTSIGSLLIDDQLRKLLVSVQFNDRLVSVIRAAAGDNVAYLPNINIRHNTYNVSTKSDVKAGWHVDCGTEMLELRNQYLYNAEYLLLYY